MTSLLRRIDLATLKKNPTAGQTEFVVKGFEIPVERTRTLRAPRDRIEIDRMYDLLESGEAASLPNGHDFRVESIACSQDMVGEFFMIGTLEYGTGRHEVHRFRTMTPDPDYLYDFEPLEVSCESCGASFDVTRLQADSSGECWSNEICPECGSWHCLDDEVTEETPRQALARRKADAA